MEELNETITDAAITVLLKKIEAIESRISRLEAFTGVAEFDADQMATNLHRRLDHVEDRVFDRGDY